MANTNNILSRRNLLAAFAATVVTAAPLQSKAAGVLRNAGNIRKLKMYSGRTGENLSMIYWIDGEYIPEAVNEISRFMRDWRTGDVKAIDTRTLDILAASYALLDVSEPYNLLSGYRTPKTNASLRRGSRGVARNSLHMRGQAADVRLSSRSVAQMTKAAKACAAGGVGSYPRSDFVHMDCGNVRSWRG